MSMIIEAETQPKLNFWVTWVIANAIGLGIGMFAGEFIGRRFIASHGLLTADLIGSLICAAAIWITRIGVLSRFQMQKMFRLFDTIAWPIADIVAWVSIDLIARGAQQMPNDHSFLGVTSGAFFGFWIGPSVWIMLWLIRLPKQDERFRVLKRFLLALLGFLLGNVLLVALITLGMSIGEVVSGQFGYGPGVVAVGLACGALSGSLTGFVMLPWLQ